MKTIKDVLDVVLQDNASGMGGVSFNGETVRDMYEDAELSLSDSVDMLNDLLKDLGIKPIQNEKGLIKMLTVTETKEISLLEFKAWSGGADRLKTIEGLGIDEEAEQYIIDNLGESVEDTTLNDFLWFEMDGFIEEHEQRIKEEMGAEDDE